jgi:hypothetical protein|nr:MAG TPA: hypothetical protein [Caudoviricetes sp.]
MYLPPSAQDSIATQIADRIRLNTIGYGAVATRVGQAGLPEAAIVAIAATGRTDCTAKVAVHHDRLTYASATGTHVSYPTRWSDAGRIVCAFLRLEND